MGEKKNQNQAGSHKALYRKYRSKSLDEIKGQEHITKTLKNALSAEKISHAYLFTGPRGTGKTSIARILAHEINNLPYEDEKTHLDIIEIDAASNRRIDDVRELREKVHIAPVSAKYKVYIIDEVHMLTTESFNALLKTLEEPPAHVVFILATTEVHKLPATIISRTQRHSFRFIPKQQIKEHLAEIAKNESIEINSEALELLAEHGGGSFRDSISLLDQMSGSHTKIDADLVELLLGIAPKKELDSLLEAALQGDSKLLFEKIDTLLSEGITPAALASQLINQIRQKIQTEGGDRNLVKALSELMNITTSSYPRLKLETILLELMPENTSKKLATPAQPAATHVEAAPSNVVENIAIEPPKPVEDKTIKNSEQKPSAKIKEPAAPSQKQPPSKPSGDFSIQSHWNQLLEIIKKKNNPLYTVLRMAAPEEHEGGIILYFNFPFHQKKVEESKHKAILIESIRELSGNDIDIKSEVNKQKVAEKTIAANVDPAHASLIQNVQDIMGGGEVVNV